MDANDRRNAHQTRELAEKAALEKAKSAAIKAVRSEVDVPDWASDEIKSNIRDHWPDPLWAGLWVSDDEIPDVVEGLEYDYFNDALVPAREEALRAGAAPTDQERTNHRRSFLENYFEGGDDSHPYWEVFEVRGAEGNCYLLLSWVGGGQAGVWFEHFEFFRDRDAPLDWLRQNGTMSEDFSP